MSIIEVYWVSSLNVKRWDEAEGEEGGEESGNGEMTSREKRVKHRRVGLLVTCMYCNHLQKIEDRRTLESEFLCSLPLTLHSLSPDDLADHKWKLRLRIMATSVSLLALPSFFETCSTKSICTSSSGRFAARSTPRTTR